MYQARHYPHAPITEALIDLRVTLPEGVALEKVKRFGAAVKNAYPTESPREMFQAEFRIGGGSPSSTRNTIGYVFHSGDKLQAVQARLDGFTFSRFRPYVDWQHMATEARRLWNEYCAVVKPLAVTRVALRYINQMELPLAEGGLKFHDYLRTFPVIGEGPSQEVQNFLVRLFMPQRDLSALLALTEALVPPPKEKANSVAVILDIDLFREKLSLAADSPEIWSILEAFRVRKNEYFEASITDKARGLFQ